MCGDQQTAKELESGIKIVHGWFTERGNSILKVLILLRALTNVATEQTSFLAIAN